jgi:hypothetical protein
MADKTWKRRERQVCGWLGTTRKPVPGRQRDKDGDDGEDFELHIQQKHSKHHAILRVWDGAARMAGRSGKLPLVTLTSPNRPGFWLLAHSNHLLLLATIILERKAAIHVDQASSSLQRDPEPQGNG